MKTIELTQGLKTLLDDDDFEKFSKFKWCASVNKKRNNRAYASRRIMLGYKKSIKVNLHREIMDPPKGLQVDHINGDTLDNRRCNLRICTNAQNNANKDKHRDNRSGFKGVIFFPWGNRSRRWQARLSVHGKVKIQRYYSTKEEAALAYNKAALKYLGPYARLNEVKDLTRLQNAAKKARKNFAAMMAARKKESK